MVNWETFQHYKDRNPPWIKVYNTLLEDPAFAALPDASKGHVIGIWLLASRLENKIPADAKFIGNRINALSAVDLNLLYLMGFIEPLAERLQPASNLLATCATETERETEQSRERDRAERSAVSRSVPSDQRQDYAREVWDAFLRVSGQRVARDITPREYAVLEGWMEAGVPFPVVLRAMEETRGKGARLAYYGPSVQAAIELWRKAVA